MDNDFAAEIAKYGTKHDNGILIKVKIVANSKQNSFEFTGLTDYPIKLKISKPAIDGQANIEIIKYLSKILKIPKNDVSIVKGEKSSIKTLFVRL